jgi:23S rRNA (adenine2030-N6)-methyltransferase
MFSYRHGFHAGNHADVLKHITLLATLRHLVQKDAPLTYVDTHAGAGLYRLDSDEAQRSGEAARGFGQLAGGPDKPLALISSAQAATESIAPVDLLADYLAQVQSFNRPGQWRVYPGSPMLAESVLRASDRIKLFEAHPSDARALQGHLNQLEPQRLGGRRIQCQREDGFAHGPTMLPPPSRRAVMLCDPSYELKTDYGRVAEMVGACLKRFAPVTLLVWHPLIERPEAHELARRLKTLANQAGRAWLHATLNVRPGAGADKASLAERVASRMAAQASGRMPAHGRSGPGARGPAAPRVRSGGPLAASGMFIINPPHTLADKLAHVLPVLADQLTPPESERRGQFTLDRKG